MQEIAEVKKLRAKAQKNIPTTTKINAKNAHNDLFDDAHLLRSICAHPSLLEKSNNDSESEESNDKSDDEESNGSNAATTVDPSKITIKRNWWKPFCPDDMSSMYHSTKIMLLFAILAKCEAVGDKVLVFSQSLSTLDLIEADLKQQRRWERGVQYFRLDGKTNAKSRHENCIACNDVKNTQAKYVQG